MGPNTNGPLSFDRAQKDPQVWGSVKRGSCGSDFLDLSKSSGEIPSMKALIDFLQVDGPMAEKFREAKESFGME